MLSEFINSVLLSNKLIMLSLIRSFSMLFLDSNKNKLAMIVINRLMAYCCWLNVHTVPPHGVVFEIRVAGGYGARWTEDGSKVWIPTKFWYLSASITGLCTVYCPILSHNLK